MSERAMNEFDKNKSCPHFIDCFRLCGISDSAVRQDNEIDMVMDYCVTNRHVECCFYRVKSKESNPGKKRE